MAPAASAEKCELIESIGTCGFDEQGVAPPDLGIIVPGVQHLVIDLLFGPCMQHIPNVTTRRSLRAALSFSRLQSLAECHQPSTHRVAVGVSPPRY